MEPLALVAQVQVLALIHHRMLLVQRHLALAAAAAAKHLGHMATAAMASRV